MRQSVPTCRTSPGHGCSLPAASIKLSLAGKVADSVKLCLRPATAQPAEQHTRRSGLAAARQAASWKARISLRCCMLRNPGSLASSLQGSAALCCASAREAENNSLEHLTWWPVIELTRHCEAACHILQDAFTAELTCGRPRCASSPVRALPAASACGQS